MKLPSTEFTRNYKITYTNRTTYDTKSSNEINILQFLFEKQLQEIIRQLDMNQFENFFYHISEIQTVLNKCLSIMAVWITIFIKY